MSTPLSKKKPNKHGNCVTAEIEERKLTAKQALSKAKEYEASHKFEKVRIDAKTIVLKRIK